MDIKKIIVRPIIKSAARDFIIKWHYSGIYQPVKQIDLGAFYGAKLIGVATFGWGIKNKQQAKMVEGSEKRNFLELIRFAMVDEAPKNSESRVLSICFRLLKKRLPDLKWIFTYADGTRGHTGTIYRALGFLYLGKVKSAPFYVLSDGRIKNHIALIAGGGGASITADLRKLKPDEIAKRLNAKILNGFQYKYIKFIDGSWQGRLKQNIQDYKTLCGDSVNARTNSISEVA